MLTQAYGSSTITNTYDLMGRNEATNAGKVPT